MMAGDGIMPADGSGREPVADVLSFAAGRHRRGRHEMGKEIERKFLVADDTWREQVHRSVDMRQGYLCSGKGASVRARISGDEAYLNIKSAVPGIERIEFEYAIPRADADRMLATLCPHPLIEKTRHYIRCGRHTWEVDVFGGANQGLIIAEIELGDVDEQFERPAWLGQEVSGDPRYYNNRLAEHPFKDWG
jgi:adenylate cyclase